MSALLNEKHERFCREVAKGTNASRAYALAGFAGHRQNASRMMTRDDIKQRIEEIKSQRETNSKIGRDEQSGQFLQGSSGNPYGRPKGSRNKLGEQFIADLHAEWEQSGATALKRMAENDPVSFVKVTASILPAKIETTVEMNMSLFQEVRDFNECWDIAQRFLAGADDNLIELQPNDSKPLNGR